MEILEHSQRGGRLEAEACRRKSEARSTIELEEPAQAFAQGRPDAGTVAGHGLLDARAKGGHAGEPWLFRQGRAHGDADGAVDRGFRLASHQINDQGSYIFATGVVRRDPLIGDLARTAA